MSIVRFEKNETVVNELKEFKDKIEKFQKREYDADEFKHRRLIQGVYGQRQPALFMIRLKIPGGNIDSHMLEGIASAAEKFGKPVLHITTRQDIQLYYVKIHNIIPMLEHLAEYGVTTREASGATIRNLITSPFAGSLRTQSFDIIPVLVTFSRFFMRFPETQHMPRKFKMSFSDNSEDYAASGMHDLGFIATEKDGQAGFKVMIGGSLGSIPMEAKIYKEFIPVNDLLLHTLGILRAFNKHGDRSKRSEARLKFQLEKIGFEKFLGYVNEEIENLKKENFEFPEIKVVKPEPEEFNFSNPFNEKNQPELFFWYKHNVVPGIKKNEYMVVVRVPLGDLSVETARELNAKQKEWSKDNKESYITLADTQNLVLKKIFVEENNKEQFFSSIYEFLNSKGLGKIGHRNFGDVVSCLGSATCAAGITHSPGLAAVLTDKFQDKFLSDPRYSDSVISISGCANSCARHHLSTLGFSGRADTEFAENQHAPAYNVYFGGAVKPDGKLQVGKKVSEKIYAKRVPQFIESVIEHFEKNSDGKETFTEFLFRLPGEELNELVARFNLTNLPAQVDEELEFDWGKDTPYVMEYGEGECS